MSRAKMKHLKELKRKQKRKAIHLYKLEKLKRETHQKELLHKADVVLTAKDIWTEMIEDISDPSKIDEWIEKYNLTPDLEEELRKIAMNEMNKENDENG